jgi:histidine triad (HIT) family protein
MSDCKYCQIIEKKTNILYEDEHIMAVVPEKPAANGHVQIITKKHHKKIQDIENKELQQAFYASSFAASSLFENLEAHGTNIITNTGGFIKEKGHFHIDVIARKSGDNLNFVWKPNRFSEEEMKQIDGKIKDKCDLIGVEKKEKQVLDLDNKKVQELEPVKKIEKPESKEKKEEKYNKDTGKINDDVEEDKESYLVKQLRRMP